MIEDFSSSVSRISHSGRYNPPPAMRCLQFATPLVATVALTAFSVMAVGLILSAPILAIVAGSVAGLACISLVAMVAAMIIMKKASARGAGLELDSDLESRDLDFDSAITLNDPEDNVDINVLHDTSGYNAAALALGINSEEFHPVLTQIISSMETVRENLEADDREHFSSLHYTAGGTRAFQVTYYDDGAIVIKNHRL